MFPRFKVPDELVIYNGLFTIPTTFNFLFLITSSSIVITSPIFKCSLSSIAFSITISLLFLGALPSNIFTLLTLSFIPINFKTNSCSLILVNTSLEYEPYTSFTFLIFLIADKSSLVSPSVETTLISYTLLSS